MQRDFLFLALLGGAPSCLSRSAAGQKFSKKAPLLALLPVDCTALGYTLSSVSFHSLYYGASSSSVLVGNSPAIPLSILFTYLLGFPLDVLVAVSLLSLYSPSSCFGSPDHFPPLPSAFCPVATKLRHSASRRTGTVTPYGKRLRARRANSSSKCDQRQLKWQDHLVVRFRLSGKVCRYLPMMTSSREYRSQSFEVVQGDGPYGSDGDDQQSLRVSCQPAHVKRCIEAWACRRFKHSVCLHAIGCLALASISQPRPSSYPNLYCAHAAPARIKLHEKYRILTDSSIQA